MWAQRKPQFSLRVKTQSFYPSSWATSGTCDEKHFSASPFVSPPLCPLSFCCRSFREFIFLLRDTRGLLTFHHAGNPTKIPAMHLKKEKEISMRNVHRHLTACWHDSLSWGQRDPFPAWRSVKLFKLLYYWTANMPHVARGSRAQIKLDCGQSDSIVFAGQDFQELTLQAWERWAPGRIS